MAFIYCAYCQSRLNGLDKNLYFEITNKKMVNKLNQSKDTFLTKLKKINNKELAKIGDMVHKKFNLSAIRFFKLFVNNNTCLPGDGGLADDFLLNNNADIIENNSSITESHYTNISNTSLNVECYNLDQNGLQWKNEINIKQLKGTSSHKHCFICHKEGKR